jgi:methylenetetrahydrofolate reductase (NADPH)
MGSNPEAKRPGFRTALESGGFLLGAEVVTTRGIAPAQPAAGVVRLAADLLASPRIAWISITDNPGGNVMLPPDWLARRLTEERDRIVLHLSCKDLNRNAIESTLWRYASEGFHNILALTGDAPRGEAEGVFDLDAVTLLALLSAMNAGLVVPGRKGEPVRLPPAEFFPGCAVSPFKALESELVPQYLKLLRKLAAGARFVILQVGYDLRKAHEVLLFLGVRGLKVPVIGNVYLLTKTVAEMFHQGDIPGCVVSGPLLELARKQAGGPDKGRSFFRDLAARQVAAFRSLGFAGAYLGGMSKAEDFQDVIARADAYTESDGRAFAREIQYGQENEFTLYEQNPDTGLGDPARLNPVHLRALASPPRTAHVGLDYAINRLFHRQFFEPGKGFYKTLQSFYRRLDKASPKTVQRVQALERLMKTAFCGCKGCGDCALPECAFLCPRSACAKNQRNGPCGGSLNGVCECRETTCMWVRAYERLRYAKELEKIFGAPPVSFDAGLEGTPSWANFFLGRDHHKKKR